MTESIEIPYGSSVTLGSGYDLLGRSPMNCPFDVVNKVPIDTHDNFKFSLKFVESSTEIWQMFSAKADASFNMLFVNGSLSSEFLKQTSIDDYSLLFVVHVSVESRVDAVKNPALGKAARAFLAAKNFDGFKQSFGDHYVSAVTRGGEMYGIIRIATRSVQERERLRVELNASGVGWGSHGDFHSNVKSKVSSRDITVNVWANGVQVPKPAPSTVGDLLEFAQGFEKTVGDGGQIRAELQPVSTLPEYQQKVSSLSAAAHTAFDTLTSLELDYTKLRYNLVYMLSDAGQNAFDWDSMGNDPKGPVEQAKSQVEQKLAAIRSLAIGVLRGDIKPKDSRITHFEPCHKFEAQLKLPDPIWRVTPKNTTLFPLSRHTRGDTEMDGNNPITTIAAKLIISGDKKRLLLKTDAKMKEGGPDYTTFEDSRIDVIHDFSGTGLKIRSARPSAGHVRWQAHDDQHNAMSVEGTGLIRTAKCISDTDGDDAGRLGVKDIDWSEVTVVLDG
jgi:hypothetical protein